MPDEPRIWAIGDLTRRAGRAVVLEFRGPVWTEGELARVDERRGSRYLQLVERGGGREGRDAHLAAYCSPTRWQRLERKLADAGVELRAGQRLRLSGSLGIGDRGSLALAVDDVDVAALVGERLRARQDLVRQLVADNLYDANRRLVVPALALRIGLVASEGSDGHLDVVRQLAGSGFAFSITLRSAPVEGPNAPRLVRAALATFGPADVDLVVVVRGGGAKASLDVFDQAPVAHAIAVAAVPVWTGIGHTGDRSVADEVAHRCFPTPTAVGQALVAAVRTAWDDLERAMARIARLVEARLGASADQVARRGRSISTRARHQLELSAHAHARTSSDLCRSAAGCLDQRAGHLTVATSRISAAGGAELRAARSRLDGVARTTVGAARLCCAGAAVDLNDAGSSVASGAESALRSAGRPIERAEALLARSRFDRLLAAQSAVVTDASRRIDREVRRRLAADADRASGRRAVLAAYDPRRQMARGWTLTSTVDGRVLRRVADVAEGATLVTTFADGDLTSTVTGVTRNDLEDPER